MKDSPLSTIFIGDEHVSARSILTAVRTSFGPFICVLPPCGLAHIDEEPLRALLHECRAFNADRSLVIASKDSRLIRFAEELGWSVVRTTKELKIVVKGHAQEAAALRAFSPVRWRENIRSQLQTVGLLALPKHRIYLLLGLSMCMFFYTIVRILPSARIELSPSQETGNFTTNVYLVSSGASLPVSEDRVRTIPLTILTVRTERSLTYDQISKNFTGTNASMIVTVFNETEEPYSLRKGTRILNQAGMRFRLKDDVILAPKSSVKGIRAEADPLDLYGEVLGERGNVPANVKWDFPGLSEAERAVVYARNETPARGGTTSYVNTVTKDDLYGSKDHPGAKQRLEQELLSVAKQQVIDAIAEMNVHPDHHVVQLQRDELTRIHYRDFVLPDEFIGQNVTTIPLSGAVDFTVVVYDERTLLRLLQDEITQRVPPNMSIVEDSLSEENMDVHVIAPWDDDLQWVKITADLTYNFRSILDPLTPHGALLGKFIRDHVEGKSLDEANRIIKNLPDISDVEIHVWPPWSSTLPALGNSISITEKVR